jgi:tRNA A-37 threonylcarbamoyl transferase component Bud32/predicted nucleotidyltransferase
MKISCTSLSKEESNAIGRYLEILSRHRRVIGACLYGSKVAGYGGPDSDIDIIVVVKDYPHTVKYSYSRTEEVKISALIVDYFALQKDAEAGLLGEFVVGRLLHTYEALINHDLFKSIELIYKRRIILEELFDIIRTTNILCTEIKFPLEFVLFSKIKRRSSVYPAALYSYYKIYSGKCAGANLAFALGGFKDALEEIMANDRGLLILKRSATNTEDFVLQIGKKRLVLNKQRERNFIRLKLAKKLQIFSSYVIHAYAGRRVFHYTIREAESKIKRYRSKPICMPEFMASPREYYWKLDEGLVISGRNRKWLDLVAKSSGLVRYAISKKIRLGDINSRTVCYTLQDTSVLGHSISIVAKKFATLKGAKWAALNFWSFSVGSHFKHSFKVDPLFRLGNEYKALRYLRNEIGLNTPAVLAINFERRILVTSFVEGQSMSQIIKDSLKKRSTAGIENIFWIRTAGKNVAIIHSTQSALGNIKPNNIIINNVGGINSRIFFTDLEQFSFNNTGYSSDPIWDIIQFLCWSLKRTNNIPIAKEIVREFLSGYFSCSQLSTRNMETMTMKEYLRQQLFRRSPDYLEQFYPLISTYIAQSIHEEINRLAE